MTNKYNNLEYSNCINFAYYFKIIIKFENKNVDYRPWFLKYPNN